jgi:hypothetical protein
LITTRKEYIIGNGKIAKILILLNSEMMNGKSNE